VTIHIKIGFEENPTLVWCGSGKMVFLSKAVQHPLEKKSVTNMMI
jgi:hypothetical protein